MMSSRLIPARVSRFSGLPRLLVELGYEKQRIDMLQSPQLPSVVNASSVPAIEEGTVRRNSRLDVSFFAFFSFFSRVGLQKM